MHLYQKTTLFSYQWINEELVVPKMAVETSPSNAQKQCVTAGQKV